MIFLFKFTSDLIYLIACCYFYLWLDIFDCLLLILLLTWYIRLSTVTSTSDCIYLIVYCYVYLWLGIFDCLLLRLRLPLTWYIWLSTVYVSLGIFDCLLLFLPLNWYIWLFTVTSYLSLRILDSVVYRYVSPLTSNIRLFTVTSTSDLIYLIFSCYVLPLTSYLMIVWLESWKWNSWKLSKNFHE